MTRSGAAILAVSLVGALVFTYLRSTGLPLFGPPDTPERCRSANLAIVTGTDSLPFEVEVADNAVTQAMGLMNRAELEADAGMLFAYRTARERAFWMKNTPLSLDLLFIGETGTIERLHRGARPNDETPIHSTIPAIAVLEIRSGTERSRRIDIGDQVDHPAITDLACRGMSG